MTEKNAMLESGHSNDFECPSCSSKIPGVEWHCFTRTNTERLKEDLQYLVKKWCRLAENVTHLECVTHVQLIAEYLDEVFQHMENAELDDEQISDDRGTSPVPFESPVLSPVNLKPDQSKFFPGTQDNNMHDAVAFGIPNEFDQHEANKQWGETRKFDNEPQVYDEFGPLDNRPRSRDDRMQYDEDLPHGDQMRYDDRLPYDDHLASPGDHVPYDHPIPRDDHMLYGDSPEARMRYDDRPLSCDGDIRFDHLPVPGEDYMQYDNRMRSPDDFRRYDDLNVPGDYEFRPFVQNMENDFPRGEFMHSEFMSNKRKFMDFPEDHPLYDYDRHCNPNEPFPADFEQNFPFNKMRRPDFDQNYVEIDRRSERYLKSRDLKLKLMAKMFRLALKKFNQRNLFYFVTCFQRIGAEISSNRDLFSNTNKPIKMKLPRSPLVIFTPHFRLELLSPMALLKLKQMCEMFILASKYIDMRSPNLNKNMILPKCLVPYGTPFIQKNKMGVSSTPASTQPNQSINKKKLSDNSKNQSPNEAKPKQVTEFTVHLGKDKVIKVPVNNAEKNPANNAAKSPANNAAKRPANNAAKKPVNNAAKRLANNAAKKPANIAMKRPANSAVKKFANKVIKGNPGKKNIQSQMKPNQNQEFTVHLGKDKVIKFSGTKPVESEKKPEQNKEFTVHLGKDKVIKFPVNNAGKGPDNKVAEADSDKNAVKSQTKPNQNQEFVVHLGKDKVIKFSGPNAKEVKSAEGSET